VNQANPDHKTNQIITKFRKPITKAKAPANNKQNPPQIIQQNKLPKSSKQKRHQRIPSQPIQLSKNGRKTFSASHFEPT